MKCLEALSISGGEMKLPIYICKVQVVLRFGGLYDLLTLIM